MHNAEQPTTGSLILQLSQVRACYGIIEAVRSIDLHVNEGEIVTIIGANGAGKSTILMCICGIVPAAAGTILFRGQAIDRLPPEAIVRLGVSQVPEGRRIFPGLSVRENLSLGAFLRRDKPQLRQDIDYVYLLFPILGERRNQLAGTLSGGEQQMLAISRALMARPSLLLLDEPSLGLAPLIIRNIFEIIQKLNRENRTTVLLVEQNAYQALNIAHRGYVLETGNIILSGPASELLGHDVVRKAYLGVD